ncbi:ATP-binding cassette domain-containing protein [Hoyosella subflava]|nr:ATP-binding cassette domain-containing protein [Hoyosella subflava]
MPPSGRHRSSLVGPRITTITSATEFDEAYSKIALTFEPGASFGVHERPRRDPEFLRLMRLLGLSSRGVILAVITGLLITVPTTAAAVLTAIFVEEVLRAGNDNWIVPVLVIGTVVLVLSFALTLLQQLLLTRVRIVVSIRMSATFLSHLLRLPIRFFDARSPGGLVTRVQLNSQLAGLVSGQLATAAISALTMVIFAAVLIVVSTPLALAAIAMAALNAIALVAVSRARIAVNQNLQQTLIQLSGYTFLGIGMIDGIKATGAQDEYFARWAGIQARAVNAQQRLGVLTQGLLAVPVLLASLNVVVILGLGGMLVITQRLSLSELIAFHVLAASFFAPIGQVVSVASQFQNASAWLMQIDDVLQQPTAVREDEPVKVATGKLTGKVELKDITFGYVTTDPPLVENLSLVLEPGARVALVGVSGSGKSTIAGLVAGIHEPWSGQILFDGRPRAEVPRAVMTASLGKVDQSIMLFSATVAENIALFSEGVAATDIATAANDACIADDIEAKSGGFAHVLSEGGNNLSGGQRQRLEIARVLASSPTILILDEATSALDTITEAQIDSNLRRRGCTCLIVAHRLSTIRDCDQILVLENGKVIESGTHDELIRHRGRYLDLVSHD